MSNPTRQDCDRCPVRHEEENAMLLTLLTVATQERMFLKAVETIVREQIPPCLWPLDTMVDGFKQALEFAQHVRNRVPPGDLKQATRVDLTDDKLTQFVNIATKNLN